MNYLTAANTCTSSFTAVGFSLQPSSFTHTHTLILLQCWTLLKPKLFQWWWMLAWFILMLNVARLILWCRMLPKFFLWCWTLPKHLDAAKSHPCVSLFNAAELSLLLDDTCDKTSSLLLDGAIHRTPSLFQNATECCIDHTLSLLLVIS